MRRLDRSSGVCADVLLCVLSYNGCDVSEKFLRDLSEKTDSDSYDLIWIDNGSTDNTKNLLRDHWSSFSNTTVIFNNSNNGVIGGRNQGFEEFFDTEHGHLMFLDNDQFVRDNWLSHHMSVLKRGYDMIGIEAWRLNRNLLPIQKNIRREDWYSYVGCGGMLVKREVVEAVGGFDEQFNPAYFEDPDYNFRVYDAGFKIGWNFKAKVTHMAHQTLGKSNDKAGKFTKSLMKFRSKWKGRKPPMMVMPHIPEFDA